ncbi:hypothetical protein F5Y13DRAFT_55618 [Hypoxylon sp. FL1857]|nr:hypothetical protein F5Y13DRAFT_55618 [Hypoxylon sp. FL1857]
MHHQPLTTHHDTPRSTFNGSPYPLAEAISSWMLLTTYVQSIWVATPLISIFCLVALRPARLMKVGLCNYYFARQRLLRASLSCLYTLYFPTGDKPRLWFPTINRFPRMRMIPANLSVLVRLTKSSPTPLPGKFLRFGTHVMRQLCMLDAKRRNKRKPKVRILCMPGI